jgi:F-type H+-transporting ATPase subunit delta
MSTATAGHIADIYAGSLMDLAVRSQSVDAVAADLDLLSTLLEQNPGFEAFLASPYFGERAKRDMVCKILADKLQPLTLHFLFVMIDHNRGRFLPEIIGRYRQIYRAYQGYQTVEVTVAQPLSDPEKEKLSKELAEAMNAMIDLDVHVDPAVLGGVVIRYGDKMVDNSVRGRLARTVHQLLTYPQKRQK